MVYTGLASLAAAAAGAQVTHVDASKKSVGWARENQALSGLSDKPIRWIVEDAIKYMQREEKRGMKYDGIILDPPKFGRGPKGEVWEVYKSLPNLFEICRACLSDNPLFVIATLYAVRASAIHVAQALDEMMKKYNGEYGLRRTGHKGNQREQVAVASCLCEMVIQIKKFRGLEDLGIFLSLCITLEVAGTSDDTFRWSSHLSSTRSYQKDDPCDTAIGSNAQPESLSTK